MPVELGRLEQVYFARRKAVSKKRDAGAGAAKAVRHKTGFRGVMVSNQFRGTSSTGDGWAIRFSPTHVPANCSGMRRGRTDPLSVLSVTRPCDPQWE